MLKFNSVYLFSFKLTIKNYATYSAMRVLNVAEKNDAAKNISYHLSRGSSRMREGFSKYNKIYEFDRQVFGQNAKMIFTSVSGHLLGYEFPAAFRAWHSCNPQILFEAPVAKQCPQDMENIKRTLEREIRTCDKLIIWTDCDREGENIGFEVIDVCRAVKPNIQIYRAKFSEITPDSVQRAILTLGEPNANVSNAVDVRQNLDLRIGAAFTRFQTLRLKQVFPDALGDNIISYGSCQFPTLGFVVERYKEILNFISEKFWKINVSHSKNDLTVDFNWKRVKLFDNLACEVLFDICKEKGEAVVENVQEKPKTKWRPKPLDSVELEKLASRKLRINAKTTMSVAEALYTRGFISYPRTETNIFPKELDLSALVRHQTQDRNWGDFANRVLNDGPNPFQGNKSDQAHPPIHPIKYAADLQGNEQRIYELIVRHFLACLSKHAEGLETVVDIDIAGEKFAGKGLMIIARNYLEVYPYDKWNAKEIHIYQRGDVFSPDITISEGETCPPEALTEADLIDLMEKHGIGTDATHAEHIEKIKARLYVGLKDNKYFVPCTLGMALVEGYDSMGYPLSKPNLRAELEADLKKICEGLKQPDEVLDVQIRKYKEVFEAAQRQAQTLDEVVAKYMQLQARPLQPNVVENQLVKVKKCPRCGLDMILKSKKDNSGKYVSCIGYPSCREVVWFPKTVQEVSVLPDTCQTCGPGNSLLQFKFERNSSYLGPNYVGCVGCDVTLLDVLGNIQDQRVVDRAPQNQPLRQNEYQSNTSTQRRDSGYQSNTSTQRTNYGNFNSSANSDSNFPHCECEKPAVLLTAKKQGPNCGRQFYKCDANDSSQKCNFFKWADEINNSSYGNNSRNVQTTASNSNRFNSNNVGDNRTVPNGSDTNCYCGTAARRFAVNKDGPNKGRFFYSCSKPMGDPDKCGFFLWADNEGNENASTSCNFTSNSNQYNNFKSNKASNQGWSKKRPFNQRNDGQQQQSKKRKCGLCGEEGHDRRSCSRNK